MLGGCRPSRETSVAARIAAASASEMRSAVRPSDAGVPIKVPNGTRQEQWQTVR